MDYSFYFDDSAAGPSLDDLGNIPVRPDAVCNKKDRLNLVDSGLTNLVDQALDQGWG